MNKLVKARRPIRAQHTKLVNEIQTLLGASPLDKDAVTVKYQLLTKVGSSLEGYDANIMEKMIEDNVTDAEQDAEYEAAFTYQEANTQLQVQVDKLFLQNVNNAQVDNVDTASATGGNKKNRNFKLPKIELRKFDGQLKNWLGWWSQFRKIHEDEELDDSDKIQYLFQSMEKNSEAQDVVSSYPQSSENYKIAVEALEERFGRKDLLLQVYVRELLSLVISNVTSEEKTTLSSLYLKLESHLRSLATLELDKTLLAIVLFPLVESSLSVECLRAWQRSPLSKVDGMVLNPPKSRLDLLMEFIKCEVQSEQQISLAQSTFTTGGPAEGKKSGKQKKVQKTEEMPTAAGLVATTQQNGCVFCDKNQESDRCVTALYMDLEARNKKIDEKKACFQCIKPGHRAKFCKALVKCVACNGRHYPVICSKISNKNDDKPATQKEYKVDEEEQPATLSNAVNQCSSDVLLYSLIVNIVGEAAPVKARILIDPGSQRSYIRSSIAQQAKCKKIGEECLRNIVFGGGTTKPRKVSKVSVTLHALGGSATRRLQLLEEDNICGMTPKVPTGKWLEELKGQGIILSDVGVGCAEVDILIGFDYWGDILTGHVKKLSTGLVATETIFGWTLGGKVSLAETTATMITTSLVSCSQDISHLWSLEAIGIRDPIEIKSEEQKEKEALTHFKKTVTRDEDGLYVVSLPFAENGEVSDRLVTNRMPAEQRLKSVTRKLKKTDQLTGYTNVFTGWEEEGLIKSIDDSDIGHFIPHRPVFKNSSTTPVRPVYDASCRVGKNPSLNDLLHKGPNLLELIPALLLRFREKEIGVSADIRKAFQMVKVKEEDQIYQKFLWWGDESCSTIKAYQHTRVVFGMTCSPFILGAVINHHLDHQSENKEMVEALRHSFYVDNCVMSVKSMEEYATFRDQAVVIMNDAHMDLRQWIHTEKERGSIDKTEDEEEQKTSLL